MNWKLKKISIVSWISLMLLTGVALGIGLFEVSEGQRNFKNGIVGLTIGIIVTEAIIAALGCLISSKVAAYLKPKPVIPRILEGVFFIAAFGTGIWLRILAWPMRADKGNYIHAIRNSYNRSIIHDHGNVIENIYLQILTEIDNIFGPKALGKLSSLQYGEYVSPDLTQNFFRFQIILSIITGIIWFFAVRILAGRVAGCCFAVFYFISKTSVMRAVTLDPEGLFLAVYGVGLLLVGFYLKKSDRSILVSIVAGVLIGLTGYLDLLGFTLLIFALSIWHVQRREKADALAENIAQLKDTETEHESADKDNKITTSKPETKSVGNAEKEFQGFVERPKENAIGNFEARSTEKTINGQEEKTEEAIEEAIEETTEETTEETKEETIEETIEETTEETIEEKTEIKEDTEIKEETAEITKEITENISESKTLVITRENIEITEWNIAKKADDKKIETTEETIKEPIKEPIEEMSEEPEKEPSSLETENIEAKDIQNKKDQKNKEKKKAPRKKKIRRFYGRLVSLVLLLMGTGIGFFALHAVHISIAGLDFSGSLEKWLYLYCPMDAYQFDFYKEIFGSAGYKEINFIILLLCSFGIAGFFMKDKFEKTTVWGVTLIVLLFMCFEGMTSYAVPGYGLIFHLISALGGIGLFNAFGPNQSLVENEVIAYERKQEELKKKENENPDEQSTKKTFNPIKAIILEQKRKKEAKQREINKIMYALSSISEESIIANTIEKEYEDNDEETQEIKEKRTFWGRWKEKRNLSTETDEKEIKEEAKEEVKEEAKEEAKEEVNEEAKEEVKEEAKEEVKEEVNEEAKEEVKEEIKDETKQEIKDEIKEEKKIIKEEIFEATKFDSDRKDEKEGEQGNEQFGKEQINQQTGEQNEKMTEVPIIEQKEDVMNGTYEISLDREITEKSAKETTEKNSVMRKENESAGKTESAGDVEKTDPLIISNTEDDKSEEKLQKTTDLEDFQNNTPKYEIFELISDKEAEPEEDIDWIKVLLRNEESSAEADEDVGEAVNEENAIGITESALLETSETELGREDKKMTKENETSKMQEEKAEEITEKRENPASGDRGDADYVLEEDAKPRMLENPLPIPPKRNLGPMDYDYEVSDDDDYDI